MIALTGFVANGLPASAQDQITLSELSVSLWPEYDAPGVLVIYRGTLAPDVKLPVDITFAIPASAGKPSSTAGIADAGSFRYRQYRVGEQGNELLVSYNLPYRRFQMEYYYNPLTGQDAERSFEYTYQADYAVDRLSLEVQEPSGSSDFQTVPPADTRSVDAQLPLHVVQVGALTQGESAGVKVQYHKEDTTLSAQVLGAPTPSTVQFEDAPLQAGSLSTQTVIIAAAVLLLLAIGGFLMWSRAQKKAPLTRQARRHAARKAGSRNEARPSRQPRPDPAAASGSRVAVTGYCHQCGRALQADERFCPACGTQRKG